VFVEFRSGSARRRLWSAEPCLRFWIFFSGTSFRGSEHFRPIALRADSAYPEKTMELLSTHFPGTTLMIRQRTARRRVHQPRGRLPQRIGRIGR